MPPTKNHSTFMKMLRQPGCDGFHFTFVPNGQMASIPSFRLCKPKGMPMMVIISISPAMKYSMAVCSPPKINQMMLPNIFMFVLFQSLSIRRRIEAKSCRGSYNIQGFSSFLISSFRPIMLLYTMNNKFDGAKLQKIFHT